MASAAAVRKCWKQLLLARRLDRARLMDEQAGERPLQVEVEEKHPVALGGERRPQVRGRGRLADAAFQVQHRDDGGVALVEGTKRGAPEDFPLPDALQRIAFRIRWRDRSA